MPTLVVGQTDTITLAAVDTNGNPITLVPDAPPTWTNSDPTKASSAVATDHMSDVATALVAGSTTIGVSLTVNGVPFSTSDVETVVAATPATALSDMSVVLTFDAGGSQTYNGSDATTQADYNSPSWISPAFTQHRGYIFDSARSLWVFFRSDDATARPEVLIVYGNALKSKTFDSTGHQIPEPNLAYTCDVKVGGVTVNSQHVTHFWGCCWRYNPQPRTIDAATRTWLLSNNKVPPYLAKGDSRMVLPTVVPPYTIMGTSNITRSMGNTGERIDIGVLPEHQAAYLITGDLGMLASTLAWAECCGTVPCHFRDPATGAPFNPMTYPQYMYYSNPPAGTMPVVNYKSGSPIQFDDDHHPSLTFLAFMLTGDLYYLECLELYALMAFVSQPNANHLISPRTPRGQAWLWRTLTQVRKARESVADTDGLLPSSVWDTYWSLNIPDLYTNKVNAPAPYYSVLQSIGPANLSDAYIGYWQEDYFTEVLGSAVYMGYSDLLNALKWHCQSNIWRTNGTSGWPRGSNTPYHVVYKNGSGVVATTIPALYALNPTVANNDNVDWNTQSGDYANGDRAGLKLGLEQGGVAACSAPLTWLDGQILARALPHITWRTSF